ncbi:DNA alkylation repair protein [Pseudarthrobacter sp. J1738]|uniref:DNA alkylation repair protein n=1 Tax=Pseudarthrobacter sp. J1738 TaxID=3420446 RepID=UPI003D2E1B2E
MGAMNELINATTVDSLARILRTSDGPDFPHLLATTAGLDPLSLRQRTDLTSAAMVRDLEAAYGPSAYPHVAALFRRALAQPDFTAWMIWPVTETAVTLALRDTEFFDDCLELLAELTGRLTAEFAIRRLLSADLDRALGVIQTWTSHPDEHVRRLASEGTRPYLPWAVRVPEITQRPEATIPLLTALHQDPSEYVRRSVANHLNDLARHAPELVVSTATSWRAADGTSLATAWVIRHGLRTLIKKAHPGALTLQGFAPVNVQVTGPRLDSQNVQLPGELSFEFEIVNDGDAESRLAVDYVVHYAKANGSQAAKVFKLTAATLAPGESRTFSKKHGFRQMTTRVHYSGTHALELQVNGVRHGWTEFHVQA